MDRIARAAATFCGFLTLAGAVFFAALTVFFAAGFGFGAAFFPLLATFTAVFLTGFDFETALDDALRAGVLAAVARLAFGLEADLALTDRFAVFAEVRFAAERAVDLRKPFVRLLLIFLANLKKAAQEVLSSRRNAAELTIAPPLNQSAQLFAGALRWCLRPVSYSDVVNIEKHLMVIVGYATVRSGLRRFVRLAKLAPTEEVTSCRIKICDHEAAFRVHSPNRLPAPDFN